MVTIVAILAYMLMSVEADLGGSRHASAGDGVIELSFGGAPCHKTFLIAI